MTLVIMTLVHSQPFTELPDAMVFNDEKRPTAVELLKSAFPLERVTDKLGMDNKCDVIIQRSLALGRPLYILTP